MDEKSARVKKQKFAEAFPPGHFYSVLPELEVAQRVAIAISNGEALPRQLSGIDTREQAQAGLLQAYRQYAADFPYGRADAAAGDTGLRYTLANDMFSIGDAAVLFCFLRHFHPACVIEVGSGFSSALTLDTNDRFFDGGMRLMFIEPYPDRLHALLTEADRSRHRVLVKPVQAVPAEEFAVLESGDLLFIDSSHVGKAGSDLMYLLHEILPRLKAGVFIHFHDIFWPFEYPLQWYQKGRAWNEAYFLRTLLANSNHFEILFHNHFMAHFHRDLMRECLPPYFQGAGGSIYLRKLL